MELQLPDGYRAHPLRLEEGAEVVAIYNAVGLKYLGHPTDTLEDALSFWQTPGLNLETDLMVVREAGGRAVAIAEFWDTNEPHVRYQFFPAVIPEYENDALAERLYAWAEQRGRQSMARAPQDAQVWLQSAFDTRETWGIRQAEKAGYQPLRRYFTMEIELNAPPPAALVPEGFILRPVNGDEEIRATLHALWEAFKDHFGNVDEPFENYYARWMHWQKTMASMDPAMWYVAYDAQGEVAGGCLCSQSQPYDADKGWVNTLGVRRAYRKHGLGMAFLRTAFGEFYRRGKKRAGLGVDGTSLTGAVKLYESAGMHVEHQRVAYRKILREGFDLSTQKLP